MTRTGTHLIIYKSVYTYFRVVYARARKGYTLFTYFIFIYNSAGYISIYLVDK